MGGGVMRTVWVGDVFRAVYGEPMGGPCADVDVQTVCGALMLRCVLDMKPVWDRLDPHPSVRGPLLAALRAHLAILANG